MESTYTLYDATVYMAIGALESLKKILNEAEQHPNAATFFTARLVEDMNPLTFQVHYATYQAQFIAAKLSGTDFAEPEEDLDTYEKMYTRIQQALDALNALDKDAVNRIGETNVSFERHGQEMTVPVKAATGLQNMTNIYFHVSMTYAILRKERVPVGKRHWTRGFVRDYV